MDFTYPPEAEAFRAEFRAWLDANLPDDLRGRGTDDERRGRVARAGALAHVEPRARRRPVRRDRLARGVRRARRGRHRPGRVRRGDGPRAGARTDQPARDPEHRAGDHRVRLRGAEADAAAADAPGRRHLVPGVLRAGRRVRPRVAALPGRARRRQLGRERAEDLDDARAPRQLVRAARADRSRRAEAQGDLVPARRHDAAGHRRCGRSRRSPGTHEFNEMFFDRRARARRLDARAGQRGLARRDDDVVARARRRREAAPRDPAEGRAAVRRGAVGAAG